MCGGLSGWWVGDQQENLPLFHVCLITARWDPRGILKLGEGLVMMSCSVSMLTLWWRARRELGKPVHNRIDRICEKIFEKSFFQERATLGALRLSAAPYT